MGNKMKRTLLAALIGLALLFGISYATNDDLVFLVGDIFDDDLPRDHAEKVISALAERYPCYYVSGNHEYWSKEVDQLKEFIREAGVTVLEGNSTQLEINGQKINLCGVDDPTYIGIQTVEKQLETAYEEMMEAGQGESGCHDPFGPPSGTDRELSVLRI